MIKIKNISNESVTTTININEEHIGLVHDEISNTEDTIKGTIKHDKLQESIASYTVNVPSGSRFKVEPTLSISTKNYVTKSTTTNDDNGNIVSKTFNIFKKI